MQKLAFFAVAALSLFTGCRHTASAALAEGESGPLPPWLDWRKGAIDWPRPDFGPPSYYGISFDFAGHTLGLAKVSLKLEHLYPAPGLYYVNMQTFTRHGVVAEAGPENPQMSCGVTLATPDPLFPRPYVDKVSCASAIVPAGAPTVRIDVAYTGVGTFEPDGTGFFHYALRVLHQDATGAVVDEQTLDDGALKGAVLD